MPQARGDTLIDILTEKRLPFEGDAASIQVHGSLELDNSEIAALPEEMIVHGSLFINGWMAPRLPTRLAVQDRLFLNGPRITALPPHLSVGGDVSLDYSAITRLPIGFSVQGDLNLQRTPIDTLPEGLRVRGDLSLGNTAVHRFPDSMQVGGRIFPPSGLRDMADFMAGHPEGVVLSWPASQHQRLALRAQLSPFPDLWRVVAQMGDDHQLHIRHDTSEGLCPWVRPTGMFTSTARRNSDPTTAPKGTIR